MRNALNFLVILFMLLVGTAIGAEGFRIDTEVFVGSEKEPVVDTLTIFSNGRIYDFLLTKPEEITIFEPRRGVITLLDVKRKLKASLTTQEELLAAAINLQALAANSSDPIFRAAANPNFEVKVEQLGENGNARTRITLAGSPIQYTVVAQVPRYPAAVQDYKYFADWSARLNSVRPGNLPAGARLEVNDALAKHGLIPERVDRLIQKPGALSTKKIEVRSEHRVNWILAGEDDHRLNEAGDFQATFKLVTFEEYCRPAASPK